MVINAATVAHDAYTVETTHMVHTIIKLHNNQKTTNIVTLFESQ